MQTVHSNSMYYYLMNTHCCNIYYISVCYSNRQELLVKADDSDPNLQMLLKLVDLLASCSEGENLFIESVCQNIISIAELLEVTTYLCTVILTACITLMKLIL